MNVHTTGFTEPPPAEAAFIDHIATLRFDAIPPGVVAEARRLLLDQAACIVAARATEAGPVIAAAAALFGDGPAARAYLYARLGDVMDYDDGCIGAHFGCGAVAAALALAPSVNASGEDLLAAIVAGFEAGARIALASGPYMHLVDGEEMFDPVWGITAPVVFAAAGAAANLLRLPERVAAEGFALAAGSTPVPVGAKWSDAIDLPHTKYGDTGWAALAGVSGVLMAASGSTGLTAILDRDRGLFTMLGRPEGDPARLGEGLGTEWFLPRVLYKAWPCCGMLFGAINALGAIRADHPISAADVVSIDARLPANTRLPRFANPAPRTFVARQFSLPHILSVVLLDVPPGPAWLAPEWAADPAARRLRHTVTLSPLTAEDRARGSVAALTLRTADGAVHHAAAARPTERRAPSDDAGIAAKVRAQIATPDADALLAAVAALGSEPAGALCHLFETARAR
ncbi:MmgE/PrpD family protein [Acuticoccus kandeliae]|uniref:MmgE/PrpD family protein n=1 Tax=Acuticoccus kandeliae TaxID=2073160 RepID=UPI00130086BC|nr:MmgE/PrpD family protein [Acuticoccus kandeliae]